MFSKKILAIFLLGFSSGLPLALISGLLQAWFRVGGLDLVAVGGLSLVGQPYVYKFAWAPILDRFKSPLFPWLDLRRGWILTAQVLIVLLISFMATLSPQKTPWLLSGAALLLAFCSASHDIVLDAYRVEVLSAEERGIGSALAIEGYRIAMIVSGGVGFILADKLGWSAAYVILGCLMMFGVAGTIIAEPIDSPRPRGNARQIFLNPLKSFLKKERAWLLLLLILLFKVGDVFSHALSTPFMQDLNFSLTAIGTINKTVGVTATMVGVMCAGIIMSRVELYKVILFFGCLQGATNLLYMVLAAVGKNYSLAVVVFFLENLCSGMGTGALITLITGLCDKQYSATQFALLSSLTSVGRVYLGPVAGFLVKKIGWQAFYFCSGVFAVPGILLIILLKNQIRVHDQREPPPESLPETVSGAAGGNKPATQNV